MYTPEHISQFLHWAMVQFEKSAEQRISGVPSVKEFPTAHVAGTEVHVMQLSALQSRIRAKLFGLNPQPLESSGRTAAQVSSRNATMTSSRAIFIAQAEFLIPVWGNTPCGIFDIDIRYKLL